jgi:serine/threonine-protein kinase RsbT
MGESFSNENEVIIHEENDIVLARRKVREVANALGFGLTDTTRIVTAASELARNIFKYAGSGILSINNLEDEEHTGIELLFEDKGPGITDISKAMEEGYSTSNGFGMGLPGAKRLMDEMDIWSEIGNGTRVVIKKWRNK